MTTPLIRISLILVAALAFHISMSAPTRSTPSISISGSNSDIPGGDRHVKICAAARFITVMTTKGLYWAAAFTDTVLLLAPYLPTSHPISTLPEAPPLSRLRTLILSLSLPTFLLSSLSPLPLLTIAGTSLALTGALLRRTAYTSLGQFYTCPNLGRGPCTSSRGGKRHAHALITTGPYAFVRHPGYAGFVLSTTALVVLHLDVPGIYLGDSSWAVARVSGGMRTVALVCALLGTVGALRRIQDEERALRARFKGEWEAWADRVRYRLVPGVY